MFWLCELQVHHLKMLTLAINVDQCYFVKQTVVKQAEKD